MPPQSPQNQDPATALELQQGFMRRLARCLVRDEASADDLVQDTNTLALKKADTPSRAWLATVMRRLASNQNRSAGRRKSREARSARPEEVDSHATAIDRRLDLQAVIAELLRSLPNEQSRALSMRYGDDLTPSEMATQLGVPEATVKARLRRGLAKLRSDLDARHKGQRETWIAALVIRPPVSVPAGLDWEWRIPGLAGACVAVVAVGALTVAWFVQRPTGEGLQEIESRGGLPSKVPGGLAQIQLADPAGHSLPDRQIMASGEPSDQPEQVHAQDGADVAIGKRESRDEPFLAMKFDRGGLPGAFLNVVIVGEEDTILTGLLDFTVKGVPVRRVELRGSSSTKDRTIPMRVPAHARVGITAALDGMVAQPLTVDAPDHGQWSDVDLQVQADPNTGQLVLQFVHPAPSEGQRFLVRMGGESAASMQMKMRSTVVREGLLDLGRVPCGQLRVFGIDHKAASTQSLECDVFFADVQLTAGERAVLPIQIERSGTLNVEALGANGARIEADVEVELQGGLRYRASWSAPGSFSTRLREHGSATLAPPLPPGLVTLHFFNENYQPLQHGVIIRSGKIEKLSVQLVEK